MVADTLPPPSGLAGRPSVGACYRYPPPKPPRPLKDWRFAVPSPPPPPPRMRHGDGYRIPPPPPIPAALRAPPPKRLTLTLTPSWDRKQKGKNKVSSSSVVEKLKTIRNWIVLIAVVFLFSWALAAGLEKQEQDVRSWAKGVDYRHCWGKFDTPQCHERKAKENAKAYKEYNN